MTGSKAESSNPYAYAYQATKDGEQYRFYQELGEYV